ncbi:acyltransferase family protein [Anaplasma phagocytophilum str. CRT53-1]|uniref:Acyltransferase family protein n=2 Tax=Anaplasma phagocytophilum TaxID=948 RepID=A0A0F3PIY9_ANAPH|nr:1-acyl-sn-glycerol-3-phosphate acyltransferase family protein [Anaplasma phagocytophilum str. CRT38]KDB55715.1 acyl-phosphate glycerol 3-phosphate acyltransferase [Anaplasma phagocytophilum str. CRT35]KJV80253.1 acyltransferase family protein [Anaplasma phagocytophilum str. CRT53-1]
MYCEGKALSFYVLSTLFTILYFIITAPVLLFIPVSLRIVLATKWCKGILFLCKVLDGITYEVVGKDNMPSQPYIVASEHQSPLETIILFVEFPNVSYVLKQEVRFIPFIGLYLNLLKMVFIDRNQKVAALRKMVRECDECSKNERTIVIFPEGTRVRYGENGSRDYRVGIAMVYQKLRVPVVPVVINTGKYWPAGIVSFKKKRGTVTIKILSPIEPDLGKEEFMETLKNRMIEGGRQLRNE